jgi:ribosomal protein S18 acetylase RimI-like enzyme
MTSIAAPHTLVTKCNMRQDVCPADCQAVRYLLERTGFFRPDEIGVAVELVEARLKDGAESGYEFVLADIDDRLAGYACFGRIPCTIGSFDLYWIAVDPAWQRSGIGRALVSAAELQIASRGGRRLYIDTSGRDQYDSTRSFYERVGFRCEARLVDFYLQGDDKIIYGKQL